MTFAEYKAINVATEKAIKYLSNKGYLYVSDAEIANCEGYPDAVLTIYTVSTPSDKAQKHVSKQYPDAMIRYADLSDVVHHIAIREDARLNLLIDGPKM